MSALPCASLAVGWLPDDPYAVVLPPGVPGALVTCPTRVRWCWLRG
ncbi:hypothetical protein [Micromonospora rubida]|nr:hypothetical protein [Micromonospora rubida]NBE82153.1 hypothetical protein [Micromonospora rubida]